LAARESERPRVRVAALMRMDDKIVTVRHRAGAAIYHLLPGGGVDYRETLENALLREIREETGLEAQIGDPILINDTIDPRGSRHLVNITFTAEITGGSITDSPSDDRVEAVDLVDVDDLERLDMRPPLATAIREYLSSSEPAGARYLGSLFTEARR